MDMNFIKLNSFPLSLSHTHTHKLEATKMSFTSRMFKLTTEHQYNIILFKNKKNGLANHKNKWMIP